MTSSFVHHFIATCEFKLELRFGNAKISAKFYSTSAIPTFDRWPWPFTWTSLLSVVLSVVNFMMIRKKEHYDICVTEKRTGGRTDIQHYHSKLLIRLWKLKYNIWPHCGGEKKSADMRDCDGNHDYISQNHGKHSPYSNRPSESIHVMV